MLNVSEAYKTAINKPSRELRSRITLDDKVFDDSNIQNITYNSSIVASNDFEIGTAIMATTEIELLDMNYSLFEYSFEGKELKAEIAVKLEDGSFEYVVLGLFTIEKPIRNDKAIKLTGCDRMHKFEKPYISSMNYPATLLDIARDICSVAGIVLLNTSFPNSSYTVNYKPVMDNVTCRKAIAQVAELAGGYARITRDGKLEIFNISTTAKNTVIYAGNDSIASADFDIADELIAGVINVTRDNYITFTNKELSLATIDTVSVKVGDVEAKLGGDENPYYIIDNIFCQNPDAVINELYNTLNGLGYMPFNSKWQGNPAIDPGDMITIKTVSSQYNTIATSRKLTYRGGLREEYTAVGKSNVEKNSTPKGNLTLDMNKAKTEIKVLDGKIEQRVTKDDFETYTEQTDAELKARVSRGEDLKTEVTQNADSWKISINGKLKGSKYEFNGEGFTLSDDNYTTLISPMGVASCDTIFATDNVDSGKPLVMKFYIDESVNVIDKVLLRFSVQPFRAYSTAAASGGGGAVTSASGGSVSKSSGGADSSATNWDATGSAYGISLFTLEASGHSHQFNLPSHTHSMKEHTHNVSITSHSHSVTVPDHTHNIVYGIYEKAVSQGNWSVLIDGAVKATVSGQDIEVDLTTYLTTKGWHTVEVTSEALNRIMAALYIKSYVKM